MDKLTRTTAYLITAVLWLVCRQSIPGTASLQPEGFIYIDCGATTASNDPVTGIEWVPDAGYIATGTNYASVPGGVAEFSTRRYFNNTRNKNCYRLGPVNASFPYLLSVGFFYGSYDNDTMLPTFQLGIDATIVANVTFKNATTTLVMEFILWSQSNVTCVCLARDESNSTPFISSISLRPGVWNDFSMSTAESSYILTKHRVSFGGNKAIIRYPDDLYDRQWDSFNPEGSDILQSTAPLKTLTAPYNVSLAEFDKLGYAMPPSAMMDAALTTSGNMTINIHDDHIYKAQLNVYYSELDPTANSTSRIFYINIPEATGVADTFVDIYNQTPAQTPPQALYGEFDYFQYDMIPPTFNAILYPANSSPNGPVLSGLEFYETLNVPVNIMDPQIEDTMADIKSALNFDLEDWPGDPCLPYPYNWITCTSDVPPSIVTINLSGYQLHGTISPSFSNLVNLTTLHLQNNALNGSVPSWLGELVQLKELFIWNNNFSGPTPQSLVNNNYVTFKFRPRNPDFENDTFQSNPPPSMTTHKSLNLGIVIGSILGGLLALVFITIGIVYYILSQRQPRDMRSNGTKAISIGIKVYSIIDVIAATEKFKHRIGKGGFGTVYYGRFEDGEEVAVKVLDNTSHQGASEFFNEVEILSRVHHKYLVSLLGYCQEKNQQMLLYEFIHKGSLRDHLYGLEYLHTGCNPSMIHRDIKSSNILLTQKLVVAKVADFGLSRLTPDDATHVSTDIKGTIGYLDPEYFTSKKLTTKSDVFSFGVVLLELMTGREPLKPTLPNPNEWNICDWVQSTLQEGDHYKVIDPLVKASNPNMDGLWKFADIAMRCVAPRSIHRPSMTEVVRELRLTIDLEGFPSHSPRDSQAFSSSNIEASLSGAHFEITTEIDAR